MTELPRHILAIAVCVMVSAIFWYFFLRSPERETAQLECTFIVSEHSAPITIPSSQDTVSRVDLEAELTGKSVHEGGVLWHGDGVARFQGGSQELAGAVFLKPTNEVRGLSLYRDHYPHQANDLRISTLNENGNLDWDENAAFVYFENATDKLAHSFDYRCTVIKGEGL